MNVSIGWSGLKGGCKDAKKGWITLFSGEILRCSHGKMCVFVDILPSFSFDGHCVIYLCKCRLFVCPQQTKNSCLLSVKKGRICNRIPPPFFSFRSSDEYTKPEYKSTTRRLHFLDFFLFVHRGRIIFLLNFYGAREFNEFVRPPASTLRWFAIHVRFILELNANLWMERKI